MVAPSHLKSLQALEMAVRSGSFTVAAEALGITPAAAGQRVKSLEDYLGFELLVRGRSGIGPTSELCAALPHLRAAFAELEAAARELDMQRARELHIAGPSDFIELWLMPRLDSFRAAHPNIRFCINGEGDAPIRLGQVDCRIGFEAIIDDPQADLLFHDFVVPLCSRDNLERTAGIPERERLEGFPLLHLDFYKDDPAGLAWPDWIVANHVERTAPERGMRFQRIVPAIDAMLANAGVTLCGIALLRERLEEDRVALPYPVATGIMSGHAFQARYRADTVGRRHIERFRAWLAGEGAGTSRWIDDLAVAAKHC